MKSGLVSVSFRALPCEKIIELAKQAGLSCIEWGGDIHVPHGDAKRARAVGELTRAAGLGVAAYGSYYRVGTYGAAYQAEFQKVLSSAVALGAPVIRLWAGNTGSAQTDGAKRAAMAAEIRRLAENAAQSGVTLAFECHNGTLTDTYGSFTSLMEEIGLSNVKMYWQPNERRDFAYNLKALEAALPYLANVHVFHWPSPGVREPLAVGESLWLQYLRLISADGKEHALLLEFMPDDLPGSLKTEAETLHAWMRVISGCSCAAGQG